MAQLFDGACNGWNWTNNTGKGADLLITIVGCEGRELGSVTASSTNVGGITTYTYTPTPPQIGASVRIWLNTLRFDMIVPGGRVEDGSTTGSAGQWMLSRHNAPSYWHTPYYNAQGRYIDRNYGNTINVDKSVCAKAGLDPDIHNTDEFKTRVDAVIPVICNHIKELGEHLNAICQAITSQDKQVAPTQIKELVIKEV
ncbi:hypothetical protein [Helicobacter salomonis]|uniref:hypothetical protein n=1 Tax=Helicobacter salomonis TaxID=56878 RepID=UPI000CF18070|nr:hypothetical protein [Helicobacter salomonis]